MSSPALLPPGTKVEITGLQTAAVIHMNGVEGVVDHFSQKREKYVVSLPNGPMMVKIDNLKVLEEKVVENSPIGSVFRSETEMMHRLKAMGMSEKQLQNLTPDQRKAMLQMTMREDIIQKAQNTPGVIAPTTQLTMENNGLYGWRDAKTHVYLELPNKKEGEVSCTIEENKISITDTRNSMVLLQGELFQSVDVEQSVWEVTEGKLAVTLMKSKPMRWLMIIRS